MMVHRGEEADPDRLLRRGARARRTERGEEFVPVPSASTPRRRRLPRRAGLLRRARDRGGTGRRAERFGTMPLAELIGPAVRLAREGAPMNRQQAYMLEILAPIHERLPGTRELYAPHGRSLARGRRFRFPSSPRRWNASRPKARSRSTAAPSRRRQRFRGRARRHARAARPAAYGRSSASRSRPPSGAPRFSPTRRPPPGGS